MARPEPEPARKPRRWWRLARRLALALSAPFALDGLAALVLGRVRTGSEPAPADAAIEIFVESNGTHVAYVLPARHALRDWTLEFPAEQLGREPWLERIPQGEWISIGWGDRRFYLETERWSDLHVSVALQALFGLDTTALHVECLADPRSNLESRPLRLSAAQYRGLIEHIEASLARDAEGRPLRIAGRAYGYRDAFYEGRGHYHMFRTCNEWVAEGLREVGAPAPLWAPFAFQVLGALRSDAPSEGVSARGAAEGVDADAGH